MSVRAPVVRPGQLPFGVKIPMRHIVLASIGLVVAYPFYYMVSTSFKDLFEATSVPPTVYPHELHPENYPEALRRQPWGTYFLNTMIIAAAVTIGELVTAVLAGYAFARMHFRGKNVIFTLLLATLMLPAEATLVPNFVIMGRRYLNLYDTLAVQIVPFLATAFSIFLLRQFFLSIPNELQDAARIDGAGHLRFLWSVALPISVPALVTVAIFAFLASWNAFQWPLIMTDRPEVRPIQVGLNAFRAEGGSIYHVLLAAATFVVAPIVLLYLVAQKQLIQGVARTGIRG